jgi:hypothetical protein
MIFGWFSVAMIDIFPSIIIYLLNSKQQLYSLTVKFPDSNFNLSLCIGLMKSGSLKFQILDSLNTCIIQRTTSDKIL